MNYCEQISYLISR